MLRQVECLRGYEGCQKKEICRIALILESSLGHHVQIRLVARYYVNLLKALMLIDFFRVDPTIQPLPIEV